MYTNHHVMHMKKDSGDFIIAFGGGGGGDTC